VIRSIALLGMRAPGSGPEGPCGEQGCLGLKPALIAQYGQCFAGAASVWASLTNQRPVVEVIPRAAGQPGKKTFGVCALLLARGTGLRGLFLGICPPSEEADLAGRPHMNRHLCLPPFWALVANWLFCRLAGLVARERPLPGQPGGATASVSTSQAAGGQVGSSHGSGPPFSASPQARRGVVSGTSTTPCASTLPARRCVSIYVDSGPGSAAFRNAVVCCATSRCCPMPGPVAL